MKNLQYKTTIDVSRAHVWDTMLSDATYRQWTAAFSPDSHFEGDWSIGSEMRFLSTNSDDGTQVGMAAHVRENRAHEYMSLEHFGEVKGDTVTSWDTTGFENYTLKDTEDGTEVTIDLIGVPDEYVSMYDDSWPKALESLKALAEG